MTPGRRRETGRPLACATGLMVLLTFLAIGATAATESPFATADLEWGSELGPALGDSLKAIPGATDFLRRSIVVASTSPFPECISPLLAEWATLAHPELILISPQLAAERAACDGRATCIDGQDARSYLTQAGIGSAGSPLLLLVDERGRVVYRQRGVGLDWTVSVAREAVAAFAADRDFSSPGSEDVLREGRDVTWPAFSLHNASLEPLDIGPGRACLLLRSDLVPRNGEPHAIVAELDELRAEFAGIEFAWHLTTLSPQALEDVWTYGQLLGLDSEMPDTFGVDRQTYVERQMARQEAVLSERLAALSCHAPGWSIWVDTDGRLSRLWTLPPMTSVVVLDADGSVLLAPTPYPLVWSESGVPAPSPGAIAELRALLERVVR